MSEIALAPPIESSAPAASLADCSPKQQVELRYLNAASALLDDAVKHGSSQILADVLAWTLARMIVGYGTTSTTGDILHRLGRHIGTLAERRRTWEEAEKAKEEGRAPN